MIFIETPPDFQERIDNKKLFEKRLHNAKSYYETTPGVNDFTGTNCRVKPFYSRTPTQMNTLSTQVVENYIEENGNVIKHDKTIVKRKNGNQTVQKYIFPSSFTTLRSGESLNSPTVFRKPIDVSIYRSPLRKIKNIKKRKKTNIKNSTIKKIPVANRKRKQTRKKN